MLPKNVTELEVSDLFSQYGDIKDLQILRGSQQTNKGICISNIITIVILIHFLWPQLHYLCDYLIAPYAYIVLIEYLF